MSNGSAEHGERHTFPRNPDRGMLIDALTGWTIRYVFASERALGQNSDAQRYYAAGDAIVRNPRSQLSLQERERFTHFVDAVRSFYNPPRFSTEEYSNHREALGRIERTRPSGASTMNTILEALALSYAKVSLEDPWEILAIDLGLENRSQFNKVGGIQDICIRFITGAERIGDRSIPPSQRKYRPLAA